MAKYTLENLLGEDFEEYCFWMCTCDLNKACSILSPYMKAAKDDAGLAIAVKALTTIANVRVAHMCGGRGKGVDKVLDSIKLKDLVASPIESQILYLLASGLHKIKNENGRFLLEQAVELAMDRGEDDELLAFCHAALSRCPQNGIDKRYVDAQEAIRIIEDLYELDSWLVIMAHVSFATVQLDAGRPQAARKILENASHAIDAWDDDDRSLNGIVYFRMLDTETDPEERKRLIRKAGDYFRYYANKDNPMHGIVNAKMTGDRQIDLDKYYSLKTAEENRKTKTLIERIADMAAQYKKAADKNDGNPEYYQHCLDTIMAQIKGEPRYVIPALRAIAAAVDSRSLACIAPTSMLSIELKNSNGDLEEALECAKKALSLAEKHFGSRDINTAISHYNLGLVLAKMEKNRESLLEIRSAVNIVRNMKDAEAMKYAGKFARQLAIVTSNAGDRKKACETFAEAASYYDRAGCGTEALECITEARNMAAEEGFDKLNIEYSKKGISLLEHYEPGETRRLAAVNIILASDLVNTGSVAEAQKALEKAEKLLGSSSSGLDGLMFSVKAFCLMKTKHYAQAIDVAKKALPLVDDDTYSRELCCKALANSYLELGNMGESMRYAKMLKRHG